MSASYNTGISDKVIEEIKALAKKYGVEYVKLFGSRARGDYRKTSDIDLAFCGGDAARFILSVDEDTSTLLKFDIVDMGSCVDEDLRTSIEREGVMIYEKM